MTYECCLLLLFTVISFCVVESDCNILFLKAFTMRGWTFGLAHEEISCFFFFFWVSLFLHLSKSLHFWGFIIFLGKWGLLKACDKCLWFFNENMSCNKKKKQKTCAF